MRAWRSSWCATSAAWMRSGSDPPSLSTGKSLCVSRMASSSAMPPPWPKLGPVGCDASPPSVTPPITCEAGGRVLIRWWMEFFVKCSGEVWLMHSSMFSRDWKALTRDSASALSCSGAVSRKPVNCTCNQQIG